MHQATKVLSMASRHVGIPASYRPGEPSECLGFCYTCRRCQRYPCCGQCTYLQNWQVDVFKYCALKWLLHLAGCKQLPRTGVFEQIQPHGWLITGRPAPPLQAKQPPIVNPLCYRCGKRQPCNSAIMKCTCIDAQRLRCSRHGSRRSRPCHAPCSCDETQNQHAMPRQMQTG